MRTPDVVILLPATEKDSLGMLGAPEGVWFFVIPIHSQAVGVVGMTSLLIA